MGSLRAYDSLITPQGFAGLMGTMWPETIDAMPFKMGTAMRVIGQDTGRIEPHETCVPDIIPQITPHDDA